MKKMRFMLMGICLMVNIALAQGGEQLHLVPDRSLYLSGEKLWFHLELEVPESDTIQPHSSVAYLELLDLKGRAFVREKIWMEESMGQGSIRLPEQLPTAHYLLKAYTLASSPSEVATWVLRIVNPAKGLPQIQGSQDLKMIHKGGDLLADRVAHSLIEVPQSLWESWEAIYLINHQGLTLDSAERINPQYALLSWHPQSGQQYFLNLKTQAGEVQLFPIEFPKEGLHFWGVQAGPSLSLALALSESLWKKIGTKTWTVEIYSDGKLVRKIPLQLTEKDLQIGISMELEEGELYYFLLKNERSKLLSAFPYFQPFHDSQLALTGLKKSYSKREKIAFGLDSSPSLIRVVEERALGVKIKDMGFWMANPSALPTSIRSGQMTHLPPALHWIWQDYLTKNGLPSVKEDRNAAFPESRGISLVGKIKTKRTDQKLARIPIWASVTGDSPQLHCTHTDASGNFRLDLRGLSGPQNIFLAALPTSGQNFSLEVHRSFRKSTDSWVDAPLFFDDASQLYLEKLYRNQEIRSYFPPHPPAFQRLEHQIPFNIAGEQIERKLVDFIDFPSMTEVFNEIIPFTRIKTSGGQKILSIYDEKEKLTYETPLILLDGVPILKLSHILDIETEEIEKIVVMPRRYMLGDELLGGAVFIFSKKGNMAGLQPEEAVTYVKYQTLSQLERFVPPVQGDPEAHIPHFETLLYWGREPRVNVRSSDAAGIYRVEVFGKRKEGHWGKIGASEFQVKK